MSNNQWGINKNGHWLGKVSQVSVPEPSALAIFALGIMGLSARRFR